jgi:hypothetical protein
MPEVSQAIIYSPSEKGNENKQTSVSVRAQVNISSQNTPIKSTHTSRSRGSITRYGRRRANLHLRRLPSSLQTMGWSSFMHFVDAGCHKQRNRLTLVFSPNFPLSRCRYMLISDLTWLPSLPDFLLVFILSIFPNSSSSSSPPRDSS